MVKNMSLVFSRLPAVLLLLVLPIIQRHRDGPFFLYLAHSMPHIPLFASGQFEGRSRRGLYGDVIEEIDWSVGQVVDAIRQRGLEKNTIVFFTSPMRSYSRPSRLK